MPRHHDSLLWSFLFGNFVIGFGVLMVPGALNDISQDLHISIAGAGFLITAGSILMCLSAPVFATILRKQDRHQLLTWVMVWYSVCHLACVVMPEFEGILIFRVLAMISPAIFTPQAAACIGQLAEPHKRGRAITFVFLGWSVASVIGTPMAAWISEVYGWRTVFVILSVLSLISAAWVWWVTPRRLSPPVMSVSAWRQTLGSKTLMLTVLVTVLSGSGQFFLTAYFAPYFKQTLSPSPAELSLIFGWFGACGLLGNVLLSKYVDRIGSARAVHMTLSLIAVSMLGWSLGNSVWLALCVITPWGLGMFATNSAQQARLIQLSPALSAGSVALNTSAIYLGQAIGSAGGGWLIQHDAMHWLHWCGLAGVILAFSVSQWVHRMASDVPREH
jgi:predicted MFS family arabinose efflux permease